jgi:hypothetical protein
MDMMHGFAPLFERVLGAPRFQALPAPIKRLHDHRMHNVFSGRCSVERGHGPLASLLAWAASLPVEGGNVPIEVSLVCDSAGEIWSRYFGSRDFGGKRMRSTLTERRGYLEETLGPVVLTFALRADAQAIEWNVVAVKALGLRFPAAWFKHVTTRESLAGGKYAFDIRAELPCIGLLVRYRGWLDVDAGYP